jgi:coatomer subunit beta
MEFLTDDTEDGAASAVDVVLFVREAFERLPAMRSDMMSKLLGTVSDIKAAKVIRAALWVIGEYAEKAADIEEAFDAIM